MNKNDIFNVLSDWNFWKKDQDTGIERAALLKRFADFYETRQVMAVIGPRRSGKSYLMKQYAKSLINQGLKKENILIINFEDPRLPALSAKNLEEIFNVYLEFLAPRGEIHLFLDEIQEVAGWEKWVMMMRELKKACITISGSNSHLLSRELATVLTGRHIDLTVSPLSFTEYLFFNHLSIGNQQDILANETHIKALLRKYMETGAYPEVTLRNHAQEILLGYFDDIVNKDLVRRYKIRKGEKLVSLARQYLTQIASLATYNSTARALSITANTVEKFSTYLKTAYLIYSLKRFSFKVKEQEKSPRKIYAVDTGLANIIGFKFSDNYGRLAENIVFLELMRQQSLAPGQEIYYWKNEQHYEVDFVVKKGTEITELIQTAWQFDHLKTKNREIRSLAKALKEFKLSSAIVITEDYSAEEELDGHKITYIPLWQWLLKQS